MYGVFNCTMKHDTTTEWVPNASFCCSKCTVWGVHCENHKPQYLITQVVCTSHAYHHCWISLCVQGVNVEFTPRVSLGARDLARIHWEVSPCIPQCFLVMMQLHVTFNTACTFCWLASYTIKLEPSGENLGYHDTIIVVTWEWSRYTTIW